MLPFRLALALFGGLALWAAFPDIGWWPAVPFGIAALVAATRGSGPFAGFGLGFLGGLAWFVPYVSWTGIYVGPLPWLSLAVLQSLFVGLFGLLVTLAYRRGRRPWPVLVAALWSLSESLRASVPFGGFPWGRVAYTQADSPLLPLAAMGGAALLGFAVAIAGVLLLGCVDAAATRHLRGLLARVATVAALVLAASLIPTPTDGTPATFMGIQGSAPRAGLDFNRSRRQILDNHARVTQDAAARIRAGELPVPDVVIWPENASDIDPFVNADAGAVIDGAVTAIDRPVLVGAVLGGGRRDLTNTSILFEPGVGATEQRYSKRELVPFAEYMPYRAFFRAITRQVDLLERDFVPGHEVGVVTARGVDGRAIHLGLGICFEVAVDHVLREAVQDGADVLVVQTNNAMFDFTAESAQQLAISRVRAVEHGRSVIHVSNVGISALITPDGIAHQSTRLFTPAVIVGEVPLRTAFTPATLLGPWPERLIVGGALVGLLAGLWPRRRPRGNTRRDSSTDKLSRRPPEEVPC